MGKDFFSDVSRAIPSLRRYVFCLLGLRETGDRLIESVLNDVMLGRAFLNGSSVTISLFKTLHQSQFANAQLTELSRFPGKDKLHDAVLRLPLQTRAALLLTYTIGFTHDEVAEILNLQATEAKKLVRDARMLIYERIPRHDLVRQNNARAEVADNQNMASAQAKRHTDNE